jgi:hypothetical protein
MPDPLARRHSPTSVLLVAATAIFVPAAAPTAPSAPPGFADLVENARPAVVAVVGDGRASLASASEEPRVLGSGFLPDTGGLATTSLPAHGASSAEGAMSAPTRRGPPAGRGGEPT